MPEANINIFSIFLWASLGRSFDVEVEPGNTEPLEGLRHMTCSLSADGVVGNVYDEGKLILEVRQINHTVHLDYATKLSEDSPDRELCHIRASIWPRVKG